MTEAGLLRRLVDAMEEALCIIEIIDPGDGGPVRNVRYLQANRAFERHAGIADIEGRTANEAFPGLEQRWFDHFERVWRSGEPARLIDDSPSLGRIYEVSLSRIGGEEDRQITCLFRDFTLQHLAQQRALQMAAELSEADRRKTEFLATLAHELRNPLAPIRSSLDLAAEIDGVKPELVELHAVMSRQVGQLSRLVDELLDLSRISQDRMALKRSRVALSEIIEATIETCRPLLDDEAHTLTVDVSDGDVLVDVDAVRLTQVLTNLLNNAVRYTPGGGRIGLSAETDDDGLRVVIEDDGEGIGADDIVQIFEMFTQVRGEKPRENGGLGIGLTLSRRIVALHGGALTASSPGRGLGSRFEVRIPHPKASTPRLDTERSAPVALPIAPSMRVLVVDDNRDAADALAKILRLRGHEAWTVYNGRGALDMIESHRPEVVFLDIGLPDITGYQVALELNERHYRDQIELIALTGWGMTKDRERSHDAGFQHHLTKPVSAKTVLGLLGTVAHERRSA